MGIKGVNRRRCLKRKRFKDVWKVCGQEVVKVSRLARQRDEMVMVVDVHGRAGPFTRRTASDLFPFNRGLGRLPVTFAVTLHFKIFKEGAVTVKK